MPVTFPAHAAAVIPLYQRGARWLHPTALLAGTWAPDLAYIAENRPLGLFSHTAPGALVFALTAGLLAFLWLEALVLPTLARAAPRWFGVEWGRFCVTRGLPRRARDALFVPLALVLGAATHVLWDGIAHEWMWPARALYAGRVVRVGPATMLVTTLLHHLSSLLGSLLVLIFAARLYPRLGPAPPTTPGLLLALALPSLLAGALGLFWRLGRPLGDDRGHAAFLLAWPTATAGAAALTVVCCVYMLASGRWRALRPSDPRAGA